MGAADPSSIYLLRPLTRPTGALTVTIIRHYQHQLQQLNEGHQCRRIPALQHQGHHLITDDTHLINVSSNDYLGIATDQHLQRQFLSQLGTHESLDLDDLRFGSSSSRLLTGNTSPLDGLEQELKAWFGLINTTSPYSALVLNSGYHANIGLLPALTKLPLKTLILSDQLVHASIIDGIRLCRCDYQIYRHNDHEHLRELIQQAGDDYQRLIIVTESLFSMDGDFADLSDLVAIKRSDSRIELYVDEAHSIGVLGQHGLGLAAQTGTLGDIDYLIGTFGKAFASMGAYIMCDEVVRSWLINTMRPLIFSTALPPINHQWSRFVLAKMPHLEPQRQRLAQLSSQLRELIAQISPESAVSDSHIVPLILGSNEAALAKAHQLRQAGFYALPIRPPTVPKDTARIRLILNAAITDAEFERLAEALLAT